MDYDKYFYKGLFLSPILANLYNKSEDHCILNGPPD